MEKYDGIERYIYSEVYLFFTRHVNDANTDENWTKIVEEAKILGIKYENHPLCVAMTVASVEQLENIICKGVVANKPIAYWNNLKERLKKRR